MNRFSRTVISAPVAAVVVGVLLLTVSGCSSSNNSSSTTTTSTTTAPTRGSGPVDVLSAGSLQNLMQDALAPAFKSDTGYTLDNVSNDSKALANSIKGGTVQGDVFISASPTVNALLEGSSNGSWVSWYAQFATSQLVLGYNPSSQFAAALKTEPWYKVISEPGFRLGRTDPTTDPKGVLADDALDQAASQYNLPELRTLGTESSDIYPETSLVGELQAGQLDAGFFYELEATGAHIQTVPLTGTSLFAKYTITILNKAPHQAAADAFVNFLLGSKGSAILAANGVKISSPPSVSGQAPSNLQGVLKS